MVIILTRVKNIMTAADIMPICIDDVRLSVRILDL